MQLNWVQPLQHMLKDKFVPLRLHASSKKALLTNVAEVTKRMTAAEIDQYQSDGHALAQIVKASPRH